MFTVSDINKMYMFTVYIDLYNAAQITVSIIH